MITSIFAMTPHHRAMMVSIGHIFLVEVVNVYCMVPLIWRSVLNAPLFAIFHIIIAVNGTVHRAKLSIIFFMIPI